MLQRINRLHREEDYARLYRKGRRVSTAAMTVSAMPNSLKHSRIGFVAGKKSGKAVIRNRMKRRVRECVRLMLPQIIGERDMAFHIRQVSEKTTATQLQQEIRHLLSRGNLLKR